MYALAFAGWFYVLRRNPNRTGLSFAAFLALGIITSVPFVYFADPPRVLYATNPLVALLIAGGFVIPDATRSRIDAFPWRPAAMLLPSTIAVVLLLPFAFRILGIENIMRKPFAILNSNEQILDGNMSRTGFVVLPDGVAPLSDVPSMPITEFHQFLAAAKRGILNLPLEPLPEPPFAFAAPLEARFTSSDYFLPAEIFRNKSVARWKVEYEPTVATEGVEWLSVRRAKPLQ